MNYVMCNACSSSCSYEFLLLDCIVWHYLGVVNENEALICEMIADHALYD